MSIQAVIIDFPLFVLFPVIIDVISIFLAFMSFIIISFFQDSRKRFKMDVKKNIALIALYFVSIEGIILLIPMILLFFVEEGYYALLYGSEGFLGLPGTFNLPSVIYFISTFISNELGVFGIVFLLLSAIELLFLLVLVIRYQFREEKDSYVILTLLIITVLITPLLTSFPS
ncbi:MAG: hypothetical protein ACTSRU_09830 [Candidatus Hodarchaeales archaeon]